MRLDAISYVHKLMEEGPEAVFDAITRRDAIIAKLMYKLETKEIKLHSIDDLPDLRKPFGIQVMVDENDPEVLNITIRGADEYVAANKEKMN